MKISKKDLIKYLKDLENGDSDYKSKHMKKNNKKITDKRISEDVREQY